MPVDNTWHLLMCEKWIKKHIRSNLDKAEKIDNLKVHIKVHKQGLAISYYLSD